MEALSQALQPYKELVGNVATTLAILQMFSGAFVCNDIRRKGTSDGFSPMPFLGGCGLTALFLQNALLMSDPAMIRASVVGFAISAVFSVFFYLYTPRQNKAEFWKQLGRTGALAAAIVAYARLENPEVVEYRFGMITTVLMLMLIAQPLFGLPEIIRKKSTEGLPFAIIVAGTAVGSMWLLYGIILNNTFMVVQNLVGLSLSAVQLALFVIYPSKDTTKKKQ